MSRQIQINRWAVVFVAVFCLVMAIFAITTMRGPTLPEPPKIEVLAGFEHHVYANEQLIQHPVALALDEKNRLLVTETHRFELQGYERFDEQLACRTVEDGRRLLEQSDQPLPRPERLRRLSDENGDGLAETSELIFEDATPWAGCAAGIAAKDSRIWFGNSPNLWRIDETTDARQRTKQLLTGFGVRPKLLGHDLHGFAFGPDGKLYFSMGDRGLHVETLEGGVISAPDCGSILRCNPDGSQLELFATGLRNPQGLAFDANGNLWTCDNDSNLGDRSRWIYVAEGGDYGWRIGYQLLPNCGPYQNEGLCDRSVDVPWRLPAIDEVAKAPGGIDYYPGIGLPDGYEGSFLIADYAGGIHRVQVEPFGAGFRVTHKSRFAAVKCPTDVKFGVDGSVYVSDWVWAYQMIGQGRVIRICHPSAIEGANGTSAVPLLASELPKAPIPRLIELLGHASLRIRLAAQDRLVRHGDTAAEQLVRQWSKIPETAKVQACWALGQLANTSRSSRKHLLDRLATTNSARMQEALLRGLAVSRVAIPQELLDALLESESPRVAYHAVLATRHQHSNDARMFESILRLAERYGDGDPFLRHAIILALAEGSASSEVAKLASHESDAVRMVAVCALRRQLSPKITRFLHDESAAIVFEATRAIHDEAIAGGYEALAEMLPNVSDDPKRLVRVLSACHRLGSQTAVTRIRTLVEDRDASPTARRLAIQTLGDWNTLASKNRVTGAWDPIPPRRSEAATEVLSEMLPELMNDSNVASEAAIAAEKLAIAQPLLALENRGLQLTLHTSLRLPAIRAMANHYPADFDRVANSLLREDNAEIRCQVLRLIQEADRARLNLVMELVLSERQPISVRQTAIACLERLPNAKTPREANT